MLHVCLWDEHDPIIFDVTDETAAREAAIEEVGKPPKRVRAVPVGVFALRYGWGEDPDDPETDVLEAEVLDHVVDILAAIEDETPETMTLPIASAPKCSAVAYGPKDEDLACELDAHGPAQKHRMGSFEW